MKTSSAKSKGRRLQQWVARELVSLGLSPEGDIESRPMGSGGEDIIMGVTTRKNVPYSIECKNVEKLNVWRAMWQARENCKGFTPLVVCKRNGEEPLVVVDAKHFFSLLAELKMTDATQR